PCADERLLAYYHAWTKDGAGADARAVPDCRPTSQRVATLGSPHEVVVGGLHARRDQDFVLQCRVRRDVCHRLDLRARSHGRVVLDQRAAADDDVFAELATLADARLVADDRARTHARAGEDDRCGGDRRSGPELERLQLLLLGGRARRQRRRLPDDGVVEDPAVVADDRARIDDRGVRDVSSHAVTVSSDACSCSSARTTGTASRAALEGSPSPRTRRTKCSHSSRSGSVASTFGL